MHIVAPGPPGHHEGLFLRSVPSGMEQALRLMTSIDLHVTQQ